MVERFPTESKASSRMSELVCLTREGLLNRQFNGGDMASTWVAKPEVHAEDTDSLVKKPVKL